MDEMEKADSQLELEDILKEFGNAETEPEDDVLLWDEETAQQSAPAETVTQDTVRLEDVSRVIKSQPEVSEETIRFTPVTQEEEEEPPYIILPPEPTTEPYSDEWEPEYEQPISDYVPLEPIQFKPKSRFLELKRKLVEGPEKRYYELLEKGFGKLRLAIIINGIIAILSATATGLYAMGAVPDERMRLLVFGQFLALLLSALLGSYQLIEGVSDLVKRRFSPNTLLLFSLVACVADGILCLSQVRMPCCAPFSLNVTMSLWGAYQRRNTELGQMDTLRKTSRLDAIVLHDDYFQGMPGFLRTEGQIEDFMESYQELSKPEKTLNVYALVALFVSVVIGVVAAMRTDMVSGLRFFGAALLVAMPATAYITISRPMAILERRLHRLGTVLCGWRGVTGLNALAVFPLSDTDLFPGTSAKLNGVKFYGSRNPDQVVAYGTAVIVADGGAIAPLFSQLLESRNGYHYEVETLRGYTNGGIGGVVNGEAVLVGSLSFMQDMGVEMPQGIKVKQAIYVAVDGVLNGVFAISYSKMRAAAAGLGTLCSCRKLYPLLTAVDFVLTDEFIRKKFGANTKRMIFPDRKRRTELACVVPDVENLGLALTTREGLAGAAYAVTGARALRTAMVLGVAVHMLAGILGLLAMLVLTLVNADYLITPGNLLLFELIWMIPGLLITEWTRAI